MSSEDEAIVAVVNAVAKKENWWPVYCKMEDKITSNMSGMSEQQKPIYLSKLLSQIEGVLKKNKDDEIVTCLFHKKRGDYYHYFMKNNIVLPLMNKDLPWNKIYMFLTYLEELDVDIKTLIIKVLVNLVTHQIVQSTTNEACRSYESAMSYATFVDNAVFEMQLRMDFGVFQYQAGQFDAAMRTLTAAFEYSITHQPWTGGDKDKYTRSLQILTEIKSLLTEWVKEVNAKRKKSDEDQKQTLNETKDAFAHEEDELI